MKKCKNCLINDAVKYSEYSNGNFCSKKCARAYSTNKKRKQINKKVSNTLKEKYKTQPLFWLKDSNLSEESKTKKYIKKKAGIENYWKKKIDKIKSEVPFEKWSKRLKIKFIWDKYKNTCQECKYYYKDKDGKGPFAVHHIDGNHENWKEKNLILLCMNCHWKTPNWGFRGKKHAVKTRQKIRDGVKGEKNGMYKK